MKKAIFSKVDVRHRGTSCSCHSRESHHAEMRMQCGLTGPPGSDIGSVIMPGSSLSTYLKQTTTWGKVSRQQSVQLQVHNKA